MFTSAARQKTTYSHLTLLAGEFICFGMDFTSSRWLPIGRLPGANLFLPFALAFNGFQRSMVKTFNSLL
jgi:hypothetical protein